MKKFRLRYLVKSNYFVMLYIVKSTNIVKFCFIPLQITLFSDEGKKLHSFKDEDYLGSVCSLNALHPTLDLVVGTNSSGRLHVFM